MSRFDDVRADVLNLLDTDVSYDGWELQTGDAKAFYVRGFTWFRREVLGSDLNIMGCKDFAEQVVPSLRTMDGWLQHGQFAWLAPFSGRQFIDAASPRNPTTPKFHKAASIILMCEIIAEAMRAKDPGKPGPDEVYERMRIEPAVSFIHGLDRGVINRLTARDMEVLRLWTGQRSNDVFADMAMGATVTDKLARRTRLFFQANIPDIALGEVDFFFSDDRVYNPSKKERFDVKDDELDPGAQAAIRGS